MWSHDDNDNTCVAVDIHRAVMFRIEWLNYEPTIINTKGKSVPWSIERALVIIHFGRLECDRGDVFDFETCTVISAVVVFGVRCPLVDDAHCEEENNKYKVQGQGSHTDKQWRWGKVGLLGHIRTAMK